MKQNSYEYIKSPRPNRMTTRPSKKGAEEEFDITILIQFVVGIFVIGAIGWMVIGLIIANASADARLKEIKEKEEAKKR